MEANLKKLCNQTIVIHWCLCWYRPVYVPPNGQARRQAGAGRRLEEALRLLNDETT